MIVNKYKGNGGGGGGYVLPVATASRLGGIKVGSGLTIDGAGVLSAEGGSEPVDFNKLSPVSVFPENPMDGEVVAKVREAGFELVFEQANVPFSAATQESLSILEIECEFGNLHVSALQDGDVKSLGIYNGDTSEDLGDYGEDAEVTVPGADENHEWHVSFSNESKTYTVVMYNMNDDSFEELNSDNITLNECGAAFNDPHFLADGLYQYDPEEDEWVPVGGEGGEGIKVYEYDDMNPQTLGTDFPSELDGYLEMGTPVYAVFRPNDNTVVYMALHRKQGNQRMFEGFSMGYRYTFSVIEGSPEWTCSVPTNIYYSDYSVVNGLPSSARTTNGQMVCIPAADKNITVTAYTFTEFHYDESEGGYTFATWGSEDEIHYDNGEFYWVWENDNELHTLPNSNMGYYRCGRDPESDQPVFNLYFTHRSVINNLHIDGDYAENYVFSSGRTTIQIHQYLEEYRRTSDGTYEQVKQRWNIEDEGTFENLGKLTAKNKDYNFFCNGWPVQFEGFDEANPDSRYVFHKIPGDITDPNGSACASRGADVFLYEDGRIEESVYGYEKFPVRVEYNISTSGLSGGLWVRTTDSYWGGNPIVFTVKEVVNDEEKIVAWTQNVWFRELWDATEQDWRGDIGEHKVFGAQFVYKADTIVAEWAVENNDGQSQLLSWRVINEITPTYETHDATDSTDPFPSGE